MSLSLYSYQLNAFFFKTYNSCMNLVESLNLTNACRKKQEASIEEREALTSSTEAALSSRPHTAAEHGRQGMRGWRYHGPSYVHQSGRDLRKIACYVREGKVLPVLSKKNIFQFNTEDVQAAFRRVEQGHTKGKVVVVIGNREDVAVEMRDRGTSAEEKD